MYNHDDMGSDPSLSLFKDVYAVVKLDTDLQPQVLGYLADHYMDRYDKDVASGRRSRNDCVKDMINNTRDTDFPSVSFQQYQNIPLQ